MTPARNPAIPPRAHRIQLIGAEFDQRFAIKENTEPNQKESENQFGVFELQLRAQERAEDHTHDAGNSEQQEQSPLHVPSEKDQLGRVTENMKNAG